MFTILGIIGRVRPGRMFKDGGEGSRVRRWWER